MKNDKKKIGFSPMKKVISAAGMLAVSASMLATSTYAWFSMNTQVTAKGMQVKAKVTGSLYIYDQETTTKPEADKVTSTEMNFAMPSQTELKPTSTKTLGDSDWYTAAAASPTAYGKATNASYSEIATANLDEYRLLKTVYVRGENAFTDLQVTGITINQGNDDVIDDAVTIAVKCRDSGGQAVWYCNETTTNRNGAVTGALTTDTLTFTQVSGTGLTGTVLASGAANTVYTVDIYIYYDGMSTSCYTNAANTASVDGLNVALTLGATFAS